MSLLRSRIRNIRGVDSFVDAAKVCRKFDPKESAFISWVDFDWCMDSLTLRMSSAEVYTREAHPGPTREHTQELASYSRAHPGPTRIHPQPRSHTHTGGAHITARSPRDDYCGGHRRPTSHASSVAFATVAAALYQRIGSYQSEVQNLIWT